MTLLDGRIAIVTGAGRGLGRAHAVADAIADRSNGNIEGLCQLLIREVGPRQEQDQAALLMAEFEERRREPGIEELKRLAGTDADTSVRRA